MPSPLPLCKKSYVDVHVCTWQICRALRKKRNTKILIGATYGQLLYGSRKSTALYVEKN